MARRRDPSTIAFADGPPSPWLRHREDRKPPLPIPMPSADLGNLPRPVADHIARPRSALRRLVPAVVEPAFLERQATAADALVEQPARSRQRRDLRVDPRAQSGADPRPVGAVGRSPRRQSSQLVADLLEAQPHLLRDQDEGDAADIGPQEATLSAAGAQRLDQPLRLVKSDRRHRDAGARGEFADRDQIGSVHDPRSSLFA